MKKKLLVKIPKTIQEQITGVSGNVISVDFSSRHKIKDFSNAPIVIGSNPQNMAPTIEHTKEDESPDLKEK